MRRRIVIAAMAAALCAGDAAAQTAEIHVLASNGIKAVMEELRPRAERAIGRPLAIEFNSSSALKQEIDGGKAVDVAIVTSELMDDLTKEGKIASGTSARIARSGIGVGIRAGAPKPDIRTVTALKQTLLKAKSITFAQDGASRVYLEKLFDRLGIGSDLKPKILLEQGSTRATARVANGSAEMVLTLVSEILPAPGVELLGPLPAEAQNYVSFSAGISSKARDAGAGKALIEFLTGPGIAPVLKAKGMEEVR